MNLLKKIYQRVYQKCFCLRRDFAGKFGLYDNFFKTAKGHRIIIYHGICENDPTKFNSLFITRKRFEQHLQFYKKYFHVISTDDFFQKKFNPGKFNICLSFDDGFANNYHYALPLLEKFNIPATFFVTAIRKESYNILWNDFLTISSVTGPQTISFANEMFSKYKGKTYFSNHTGRTLADSLRDHGFPAKKEVIQMLEPSVSVNRLQGLEDYWLQMTADEIKKASQSPLITIGSHGYYHNDLARIPVKEIIQELKDSKSYLESVIKKPVTQIAFPYGSYSMQTVAESINAGYEQLYATAFIFPASEGHSKMRERMGVNPYISTLNQMYSIVKGSYA